MTNFDKFDCERTNFQNIFWFYCDCFVFDFWKFTQFVVNQSQSKLTSIDRNVDFTEYKWNATDVVFVTMGKQNCLQFVTIFQKIRNVWNDQVNTWKVITWESKTTINDYHIVAIFNSGHIFSDFTYTTQKRNFNFVF